YEFFKMLMITLSNVNTKHVAIISEFIEHEQDEFERCQLPFEDNEDKLPSPEGILKNTIICIIIFN
ncbi:6855_t:CDS:2, partial [Rhizophagus irregularis]